MSDTEINIYTKEEFLVLHDIIDAEKHNASGITITFNFKNKKLYISEDTIWDDDTIYNGLVNIIKLIAKVYQWNEFYNFVFSKRFEDVPLEVGRTDNLSLLVNWRLKIGR